MFTQEFPIVARLGRVALSALLLVPLSLNALASPTPQAPQRGPRHIDARWHALVHATVIPRPDETIDDATVVLRDGLIVSVTAGGAAPAGARVWDCEGLTVYAGFIEPHLPIAAPAPTEQGAHWNSLITPQRSALDGNGPSDKLRKSLRKLGFTAACTTPEGGILRGQSALIALGSVASVTEATSNAVLETDVYQEFAFETAGWSSKGPRKGAGDPSSEMGAIALLRQVFLDVGWYATCQSVYAQSPSMNEPPARSDALAALARSMTPLLFDARTELQALRAASLLAEFDQELILKASGTEFRRLAAIVALDVPVICPLDFPDEPQVATLAEAEAQSLRALMTWEQAPTNARRLLRAGLTVALTTDDLDKRGDFAKNLRIAIEHGLSETEALAMLTVNPAQILGAENRLGQVAPGFLAHLLVTDGPVFAEDTQIRDVWVGGRRYEINAADEPKYDGHWSGTLARLGTAIDVATTFDWDGKQLKVKSEGTEAKTRKFARDGDRVRFLLDTEAFGDESTWSFSGAVEDETLLGNFVDATGALIAVRLKRSAPDDAADGNGNEEEEEEAPKTPPVVPDNWGTPFGAYGLDALPEQNAVLLSGATVWTSGPAGIIENGAVLIADGRVLYVGASDDAPRPEGALVLDLAGKHVTPGIIDCHSHTGISGQVNEMGQRVTSEVRVADVINPDSINWYRQLAGGMTAANQLHGSGNAIGGQNSVVKARWGVARAEDMRLTGAKPGIKFALGENPKRVAQDTEVSDEYPQTRMGVAALIRDRLLAGSEYRAEWERYEALESNSKHATMTPRRDLELEALGEVVAGERLVHCHSYRQDEILMLCRMAQELGFKIGTFQHVLEGYKVADAIAEAAIGGSTFADWWGYKFEVVDAIPHNAGIMHDVGVVTSINSDSSDHARRLNTEAGKLVKYSGLDPADALALVTINPAIQLMVDDRIGSLELGKDADVVVWSGDPLSYRSRVERTFVDGRQLFSLESDAQLRASAAAERQRIIQKLRASGKPDAEEDTAENPESDGQAEHDEEPERWLRLEAMLRAGAIEGEELPGSCGCETEHHQEAR